MQGTDSFSKAKRVRLCIHLYAVWIKCKGKRRLSVHKADAEICVKLKLQLFPKTQITKETVKPLLPGRCIHTSRSICYVKEIQGKEIGLFYVIHVKWGP